MVLFNYSTKELTAKIVYYGPGLCGKTTNLQWIHEKIPIKNKGKMLSLATEADRTLFFDFLPIELGLIRGMKTRIQLYTVPGQVFYNATRRMVLKGADAVVFVADSQETMIDANLDSLDNLRQNLEANEIDPNEIPMVLQYNKRDLPNALPIEILNEKLNPRGLNHSEAVAIKGMGVEETLKAVTGLVFRSLAGKYGSPEDARANQAAASAQAAPVAAPRPAPAPARPASPLRADTAPRRDTAPPQALSFGDAAPPLSVPASSFAPMNMGESQDDALLESLDLEAAPESEENLLVDELDVEEVALDDLPAAQPSDPRATMVSTPKDAEDLRRRITAPVAGHARVEPAAELQLGEPEEIPVPVSPAPPASLAPPVAQGRTTAPVPRPAAVAPAAQVKVSVPAQALGASGTPEVTVPITVVVDKASGQATVNLKLQLQIKLR